MTDFDTKPTTDRSNLQYSSSIGNKSDLYNAEKGQGSFVGQLESNRSKTGEQQQSTAVAKAATARQYVAPNPTLTAAAQQRPPKIPTVIGQHQGNAQSTQNLKLAIGAPYELKKPRKPTDMSHSQGNTLMSQFVAGNGPIAANEMRGISNQLLEQQFQTTKSPKRASIAQLKTQTQQDTMSVYTQPSSNVKSYGRYVNTDQAFNKSQRSLKALSMAQRNRRKEKVQNRFKHSREPSQTGTFTQMSTVNLNCQDKEIKLQQNPDTNDNTNINTINNSQQDEVSPNNQPMQSAPTKRQNPNPDLKPEYIQYGEQNVAAMTGDANTFKKGMQTYQDINHYKNSPKTSPNGFVKSSLEYSFRQHEKIFSTQTNFLNRRMTNRQSTKHYGGTSESVSPSTYFLKQLTGSKNVFESNYKKGPQHSFGKQSTGRAQIKNNHKKFFSFYNYRSGSNPANSFSEEQKNKTGSQKRLSTSMQHLPLNFNQSSCQDQKLSQGQVMLKQMSGPLQSGDARNSRTHGIMYFHRTSTLQNPGAGDYVTEEVAIDVQQRSPRPTIGKEKRFFDINEQMIQNYKAPIPIQHVKEHAKMLARKSQQGCIGNANRLNPKRFEFDTPGVGSYNMSSYASLAVAKQTDFTQYSQTRFAPLTARPAGLTQGSMHISIAASPNNEEAQGQGQSQNDNQQSDADPDGGVAGGNLMNGMSIPEPPKTAKAGQRRSQQMKQFKFSLNMYKPRANQKMGLDISQSSNHLGSPRELDGSSRSPIKLGGPSTINANKLNNCSRDERDRIAYHENLKSFNGKGVPGPLDYKTDRISALNTKYKTGSHFSISKERRNVGYQNTTVNRSLHFGVAHLTADKKAKNGSIAVKMNDHVISTAECHDMKNHDGPASVEAKQMSFVHNKGQPTICYSNSYQQLRLLKHKSPTATIGSFKDRFDPAMMGTLNTKDWKKGLKYN